MKIVLRAPRRLSEIHVLLSRFPRLRFSHGPTPIEPLEQMTRKLGGPKLFVKRDDCTGLAGGGNKARKLEFLMGDALAQGATCIVTQGATQSNHARQTAAISAKCGLACTVVLEDRTGFVDEEYLTSGNVFLDDLLGAEIRKARGGTDMDAEMAKVAEELRAAGGRPYVIPGGGSNPVGALGYAQCALELVQQANDQGLQFDWIVHGTGSAGTQAGLLAGLESIRADIPVLGISVRAWRNPQEERVFALAEATASHIGAPGAVRRSSVRVDDRFVGDGYGVPTDAMVEAVRFAARTEGLLLDPVYSGKAMAGLMHLIREGFFKSSDNVVFLHTGGSAALFGYRWAFM
jgi:L-cysteate sulfo-lyase